MFKKIAAILQNIFNKPLAYYQNIEELPIYNWFKIQQTNNLSFLLKKEKKITANEYNILDAALKKIIDEYIDTFGISDDYRKSLELTRDIRVFEIDYLLTKDKTFLTEIEIKKDELAALNADYNKLSDYLIVKIHAEKYLGHSIDVHKTTVKEFYYILHEMIKENEIKLRHERPNKGE